MARLAPRSGKQFSAVACHWHNILNVHTAFPHDPDFPSLASCSHLQTVMLHAAITYADDGSLSWTPLIDLLWELPTQIPQLSLSLVSGPVEPFVLFNAKLVYEFLSRLDWSVIERALKHCSHLQVVDITNAFCTMVSVELPRGISWKVDLEGTATAEYILQTFSPWFRPLVRFG